MSNCAIFWRLPRAAGTLVMPTTRGRFLVSNLCPVSLQLLPTDPVGVFTLTLTNVVVGSRVNIAPVAGGATLYNNLAASTTVVIPLSVYSPGNPSNDLRIRVRNASGSPTYKPYETQATAQVGAMSVFVSQVQDE